MCCEGYLCPKEWGVDKKPRAMRATESLKEVKETSNDEAKTLTKVGGEGAVESNDKRMSAPLCFRVAASAAHSATGPASSEAR